jgi:Cap4 dsDNA endonuclease
MTVGKRLGEVAPSDKVGQLTGRQYEYQHEQATMGALEMLAQHDRHCVYCEWHDDFVVEVGQDLSLHYKFHQVKSKSLSSGPWSFHELFGVSPPRAPVKTATKQLSKAKPPKALVVGESAIFLRLLAHDKQWGKSCGGFIFVTNTAVDPIAQKLLDGVASSTSLAHVAPEVRALFDHVARGYCDGLTPAVASIDELFVFFRRFAVVTEQGSLKQASALNEICDRVFEYSEIDLAMSERRQIARQLVQLIRTKATDTSVKPPVDDGSLRAKKGVVVSEVLGVLSLSHEGYKALKAGGAGKDLVKTLSRLDRFCRGAGLENFTSQICSFKAKWDVWRTKYRHQLADADHVTIVSKAQEIRATKKQLTEMVPLAKEAAEVLNPTFPTGVVITPDEVLGLLFSLAADAEPR